MLGVRGKALMLLLSEFAETCGTYRGGGVVKVGRL